MRWALLPRIVSQRQALSHSTCATRTERSPPYCLRSNGEILQYSRRRAFGRTQPPETAWISECGSRPDSHVDAPKLGVQVRWTVTRDRTPPPGQEPVQIQRSRSAVARHHRRVSRRSGFHVPTVGPSIATDSRADPSFGRRDGLVAGLTLGFVLAGYLLCAEIGTRDLGPLLTFEDLVGEPDAVRADVGPLGRPTSWRPLKWRKSQKEHLGSSATSAFVALPRHGSTRASTILPVEVDADLVMADPVARELVDGAPGPSPNTTAERTGRVSTLTATRRVMSTRSAGE